MGGWKKQTSRKKIAIVSRIIITLYQILLFGMVWFMYYNLYAFRTHRVLGGIISVLVYTLTYNALGRLYRAFEVETYPLGETVFSQILSLGLADLLLYVECCLISRHYVNLLPGGGIAVLQIIGTMIWAVAAKRYFMAHIIPAKTLIIYGNDTVAEFKEKLNGKYKHIFQITKMISSDLSIEQIKKQISVYENILLYEVGIGKRTDIINYCISEKKPFYLTPRISDIIMEGFENRHMVDTPLIKYEYRYHSLGKNFTKRIMDIIISILGIVITLPTILVTMAIIKLEDGGDIFFRQIRYTRRWKKFSIIKFRSMVMDAEMAGKAIPCKEGDDRITRVGKVIRRFRIDELPQLFNVLKGDMSIVGPRPERVENVEEYVKELPEFAHRMKVKGGLTGYAQIYGKYNTSAYDKLRLDLMYIENQSLLLDLKIIMLTFKILFISESTEGFKKEDTEPKPIPFDTIADDRVPLNKVN